MKTKKTKKTKLFFKKEEERMILNGPKRSKLEREKFLAVGETCMAMLIVSFSRI